MWLDDNAKDLRKREATARKRAAVSGSIYQRSCDALASCHAAAALIYETELSKLGPHDPSPAPAVRKSRSKDGAGVPDAGGDR
jgi:hypothetical protein